MGTQFYLTLLRYFPNNTIANFKGKLAEAIELIGAWEVALTEIHYPHSWSTIREGNQQTFIYKLATGVDETGLIPDGHYNLVPDLV